jgi:hypothetical protein
MSTLKVNGIRHTAASSDAITTVNDGTCTAKITNRSNRNIIINGAMTQTNRVARGTTSVGSVGTGSAIDLCDRWNRNIDLPSGVSNFTMSQDTDCPGGFGYSLKITPNQSRSGSLSASDRFFLQQKIEAQNIRNSGWDYTNASSKMTFSFWIKSNLTGIVTLEFNSPNTSSSFQYFHETITINSANTWEKKSIQIIGNSNLAFNGDADNGLSCTMMLFAGPNFTSGTFNTGVWESSSSTRANSSNIDLSSSSSNAVYITGVQLEVGDTATDYAHELDSETLARCQRYAFKLEGDNTSANNHARFQVGYHTTSSQGLFPISHPVPMRAVTGRSVSHNVGTLSSQVGGGGNRSNPDFSINGDACSTTLTNMMVTLNSGRSVGGLFAWRVSSQNSWYILIDNEL